MFCKVDESFTWYPSWPQISKSGSAMSPSATTQQPPTMAQDLRRVKMSGA